MTDLPKLRRIRWAARGVLVLGLLASTVGNVLHAQPKFVSQAISAWPVLALYLTIELIARVPMHRTGLAVGRVLATAVIAGIAAWVSYWHMAAVASEYGETAPSQYLLPFSVDGLIVIASICLVELGGRIAAAETEGVTDGQETGEPRPEGERGDHRDGGEGSSRLREGDAAGRGPAGGGDPAPVGDGAAPEVTPAERVKLTRPRKRPPTVAGKVARAHKQNPDASHAELARRLDLSPATVKRHRPKPEQINGNVPALVGTSEEEN